ncbi:MAG: MBL fold metallo-hydrolase [Solirubrobacterales bacterium]
MNHHESQQPRETDRPLGHLGARLWAWLKGDAAAPDEPDETASVDRIAPGVACMSTSGANVCFVTDSPDGNSERWMLIDTGDPQSGHQILHAANRLFGKGSRPEAIFLTHGHIDHAGAAAELAHIWDVPVYAHETELPYLMGQATYPPTDPGAWKWESIRRPDTPIDLGDRLRTLPEDGSLPAFAQWHWIASPGHSPGHVSYFRDSDQLLIAGDAILADEAAGEGQLETGQTQGPAFFSPEWETLHRLCGLKPSTAITGHGNPLSGVQLSQCLTGRIHRNNSDTDSDSSYYS